MLKFIEAAIRIQDLETNSYLDICGKRHHEIIKRIHDIGYGDAYKKYHVDGFMVLDDETGSLAFVDREEATSIAEEQNIKMISPDALTSEDLW